MRNSYKILVGKLEGKRPLEIRADVKLILWRYEGDSTGLEQQLGQVSPVTFCTELQLH